MKSSRSIIVVLVLVFTMDVTAQEARAWGGNDHKSSIEQTINKKLRKSNFSNEELELLYKSVVLADANEYRSPEGKYIGVLHGRGNYVIALKYVYELAFKYLDENTNVDDMTFINNYFNECTYLTPSIRQKIGIVNPSLIKLVTTKILYTSSDYEFSNREKAIKIFGFACHLAGDIYAHSTIVPRSTVSYTKYNPILNFNESNFVSTPEYSSSEKWSNFKAIISKYEVPFVDLNNLNTISVVDENGSNIKLKTLYDENLLKSISFDLKANLFEDNSNFHSRRFDATLKIIKKMVFKFNNGLIANKNKQQFNDTFNKKILNYYNQSNLDYELRNFNFYYSSIK